MFLILFDDKSLWNETFLVTADSLQRVINDIPNPSIKFMEDPGI